MDYKSINTIEQLQVIQSLCTKRKIKWQTHCVSRMQERDISRKDVLNAIGKGEIIEAYPDDYPTPSCLIMGQKTDGTPLHVVVGANEEQVFVITTYVPDATVFETDLKMRKER